MRQYLDKNDTIGEIRQARKHPVGKNYIWVLVEGSSDQKLFAKLIDGQDIKVEIVNGGGKNELREAISILLQETNQIIGIRDADFSHLNQEKEDINVLFLTDCHDSELLLISCDTAFEQVVAEYSSENLPNFREFRNKLLSSLTFLSGLRWLNDVADLGLNFKGLGLANFFDASNLSIDKNKCLQEIENRSPNRKRMPDADEIVYKSEKTDDYYNLCNGHDTLKLLALYFTQKNKKGICDDELGNSIRISYRKEDFKFTTLFSSLKQWEISTGYTLFGY